MRRTILRVFGKVQGVFFRDSAVRKATSLGLTGFVRNEDDGSVRIEIQGDPKSVESFIAWSHIGPPAADVDHVDIETGEVVDFVDFSIHPSH